MYKKNNKATYVGFFFVIAPPKKAVNIWISSVLSASRVLKKNLMWCSTNETDGSLENHKHPAKFSSHFTSEADILSSRSLLYLLHWILMHICCLEGHFHVKLPHLMAFLTIFITNDAFSGSQDWTKSLLVNPLVSTMFINTHMKVRLYIFLRASADIIVFIICEPSSFFCTQL